MAELMRKMAPMAVVALVFSWCCWPYISGSATGTLSQENGNVARLPKDLLSPILKPANDRDPFRPVKLALGLLKGNQPALDGTGLEENNSDGKEGTEAAHGRLSSFVLGGTYVQGDRRMAIISGKVYGPGDTLAGSDGARESWVVKQILPEEVLIQCGTKTARLTYPDPTAPTEQPDPQNDVDPKPSKRDAVKSSRKGKPEPVNSVSELLRQLQEAQNP